MSLLLLLLPAVPMTSSLPSFTSIDLLPTVFHMWSLNPRSPLFDFQCLDIVSSIVADAIVSPAADMDKFGLLSSDQLSVCFTTILRLLEVPVSFAGSPYVNSSETVVLSDKDKRGRCARPIATVIVYSMIGNESLESDGIMDRLENLIHSIETFVHPSNQGTWTKNIVNTVSLLVDYFTLRWNSQDEPDTFIPKERHLTVDLKLRFVKALRNVAFMGIHAKSSSVVTTALGTLQGLAYLAPDLIIPRLLKEVYPSLQGLVETHRTMSSLRALSHVTRIISQNPRYAFHLTTLLSMAIPGIDPNDLSKTLQSLSFIQTAALNVPFYDLSEGEGTGLAMDYVTMDMGHLEEMTNEGQLPEVDSETLDRVIKSSSAAFGEFVRLFLGRVLNLLENLPEQSSSKSRDLPEAHVVNTLPPTMNAVLGAVSMDIYEVVLNNIVEFVSNTVIASAADAIAQLCGSLVKVHPEIAFKKIFPVLYTNIKYEVEENGAGSTRSMEILPRDRPLIWHISALNMALAHAGQHVLPFFDQLMEISVLLREQCKGAIVFHISNTIHHALTTLTSVFIQDLALVDGTKEQVSVKHWGYRVDPKTLNFNWHNPAEQEIKAAYELYNRHCQISFKNIQEVIQGTSETLEKMTVTQASDILFSNLTYLRTSTGGMALLFDQHYYATTSTSLETSIEEEDSHSDNGGFSDDDDDDDDPQGTMAMEVDENADDFAEEGEDEDDEGDNDMMELKKLREYPTGYFFTAKEKDETYVKLHELRTKVGEILHDTHRYLTQSHDNDIASFKALMYAFKVWFNDVGIERTSRHTEALTALYTYDIKYFRVSGLRKDYPRSVLARRAGLYHNERVLHNSGPREMHEMEKTLLFDVVKSALSIYPDIRRNAQSALDAASKVLIKSKFTIYPYVLKEILNALDQEDFNKAESGLKLLSTKSLSPTVKRDFKHMSKYIEIIQRSMQADHNQLVRCADGLHHVVLTSMRLPVNLVRLNREALSLIKPEVVTSEMQDRIDKSRKKKQDNRRLAETKLQSLVKELVHKEKNMHWRLEASTLGAIMCICSSPQIPLEPAVASRMISHIHSANASLKMLSSHGFVKLVNQTTRIASRDHKFDSYMIWFDEMNELIPGQKWIDIDGAPNFTEVFLEGLENEKTPEYYVERAANGWFVWPDKIIVEELEYEPSWQEKLNEHDRQVMQACGESITEEWLEKFLARNQEELRSEEDAYNVVNSLVLTTVIRIVEMGYTSFGLDRLLEIVVSSFDPTEKSSHRGTAEACGAIASSLRFCNTENYHKKLNMLTELFSKVVNEQLALDNIDYWQSFLSSPLANDFRRIQPIIDLVVNFRLESDSNSQVFKESARISLLRKIISSAGWHFRNVNGIVDNFWKFVNHPLQGVRDELAKTLVIIYRSRYIECYSSVESAIEHNQKMGDLGASSFAMPEELRAKVLSVFDQLEKWRLEKDDSSDPTKSNYILAAKTLSVWIDRLLKSSYGVALIPLLPEVIIPALLQFLNVRDEQEVMTNGLMLFKSLGNLPYPLASIQPIIDTIVQIGCGERTTWHQRMTLLTYIQTFFFRQLFMMTRSQRKQLVDTVVAMLEDVQLEVRSSAAETLAGLIRCSTAAEQEDLTTTLEQWFTNTIKETQHVKSISIRSHFGSGISSPLQQSNKSSTNSDPSGSLLTTIAARRAAAASSGHHPHHGLSKETQALIKRHAAVLGLGSLVQAFPYVSPPPSWVPRVLATLAIKAANDPGMVGKSVKSTLGDFKKTRQDTWHIDSKAFTEEQLEDLEGVLWKNYFV